MLLEFLLELVFEGGAALLELLLEAPLSNYKERRDRENHSPLAATLGYFALGGVIGACAAWVLPARLFPATGFSGVSLVLGPLGAGALMEWWGRRRRAAGHSTTNLATWYGGAAFALGLALARYFLVQ